MCGARESPGAPSAARAGPGAKHGGYCVEKWTSIAYARTVSSRLARLAAALLAPLACAGCDRKTDVARDAPAPSTSAIAAPAAPSAQPTTSTLADAGRMHRATTTHGKPYGLRLRPLNLMYCDDTGGYETMQLQVSGSGDFPDGVCPKPRPPNATCAAVSGVAAVRGDAGADDTVATTKGASITLKGHVRDCAVEGAAVVVGTSAGVFVLDTAKGTQETITTDDADRVAISGGWVAWSHGESVHAMAR